MNEGISVFAKSRNLKIVSERGNVETPDCISRKFMSAVDHILLIAITFSPYVKKLYCTYVITLQYTCIFFKVSIKCLLSGYELRHGWYVKYNLLKLCVIVYFNILVVLQHNFTQYVHFKCTIERQ